MTIKDLIKKLKKLPQEATIGIFNATELGLIASNWTYITETVTIIKDDKWN